MASTGVENDDPICPVCQSIRTERVSGELIGIAYRCGDCGAEFDRSGARVRP